VSGRLQSFTVLGALALAPVLAPVAARAQATASTGLTPDQVRTAFVSDGYTLDQALTWDWLSPPFTSFHAYDKRLGRMLLVRVYPDAESEQTAPPTHAVTGYGPMAWFENVAVAEASEADLARLADAELQRQIGMAAAPLPTVTMSPREPAPDNDVLGLLIAASTDDP
jgi:hypothetical protein